MAEGQRPDASPRRHQDASTTRLPGQGAAAVLAGVADSNSDSNGGSHRQPHPLGTCYRTRQSLGSKRTCPRDRGETASHRQGRSKHIRPVQRRLAGKVAVSVKPPTTVFPGSNPGPAIKTRRSTRCTNRAQRRRGANTAGTACADAKPGLPPPKATRSGTASLPIVRDCSSLDRRFSRSQRADHSPYPDVIFRISCWFPRRRSCDHLAPAQPRPRRRCTRHASEHCGRAACSPAPPVPPAMHRREPDADIRAYFEFPHRSPCYACPRPRQRACTRNLHQADTCAHCADQRQSPAVIRSRDRRATGSAEYEWLAT